MRVESRLAFVLVVLCAMPASGQAPFRPSASVEATVRSLPIRAGLWEMQRGDVRGGKPYSKCMTQGDWETTKDRALGLAATPPGCSVKDVVVRGNMVRTTFACKEYNLMEELEFADASFRSRAVEMSPGLPKGGVVMDNSGSFKGPCQP